MIILNTNLKKEDFEFASLNLKIMIHTRDKRDTKDFDKLIIGLAERGQVEAMELYCKRLNLTSTMNSRIVTRFKEIENKPIKEPRELMALSAFYKWHALSFNFSFKDTVLDQLETYQNHQKFYNEAYQDLCKKKNLDPIAAEWVLKLNHAEPESENDEYFRELSNSRNMLFGNATKQVNEATKLKFLNAYAMNVILFANESEYTRKLPLVTKISSDLQKTILASHEFKSRY